MFLYRDKTSLSGEAIKNVSSYHSIQCFVEHMKLWRYFDIGKGVDQLYSGITFAPDYQIILPYSPTDKTSYKR